MVNTKRTLWLSLAAAAAIVDAHARLAHKKHITIVLVFSQPKMESEKERDFCVYDADTSTRYLYIVFIILHPCVCVLWMLRCPLDERVHRGDDGVGGTYLSLHFKTRKYISRSLSLSHSLSSARTHTQQRSAFSRLCIWWFVRRRCWKLKQCRHVISSQPCRTHAIFNILSKASVWLSCLIVLMFGIRIHGDKTGVECVCV